jgi:hypothetical protein
MNTVAIVKYGQQAVLQTIAGFPDSGDELPRMEETA